MPASNNFAVMKIKWSLLNKYNQPVPRYTSYPTVPFWKESIAVGDWQQAFTSSFKLKNNTEGISLYIHLPFCESLCTYCGCNKKITTNHSVEEVYMKAILAEWNIYLHMTDEKPVIKQLHLGGGTPTFFSPDNLKWLVTSILENCVVADEREFSIEGHPNNTTREHLQVLYDLGFRRISYGVQDNDPLVQKIINRIQPFERLVEATNTAREIGFTSINFDLIYGLPLQTMESMERTINQCVSLKPDRVAFYSYAHVPWTSRGQRLFDENDLPSADLKMKLYMLGKELFTQHGYYDIGMDHFSLPTDDLYKASLTGKVHRNFMGYTTQPCGMLIGLGVSSISDIGVAYAQNEKTIHDYYKRINESSLAIQKGYFLNDEDLACKKYILNIICTGKTTLKHKHWHFLQTYTIPGLHLLEEDELVSIEDNEITVTSLGKNFLRNICKAFDMHLQRSTQEAAKPIFSKAI
jgi:oxygen-independent coproporphyrinogen III oxidase